MLAERIKLERSKKELSQMALSKIIGVSQQTIGSWETGRTTPDPEMLSKLADFFGVSIDSLLGRSAIENSLPPLTDKDNKEITAMLEEMKHKLMNQQGLMFDGNPATQESIQSILDAMQIGMEMAKKRNKEKYTPKKYKKD